MSGKCQNCKYMVSQESEEHGDCRRYPPSIFREDEHQIAFLYPVVEYTEWCGEWTEKDD